VLARALGLFTTASKLMVKSAIGRYQDGERALLVQLLRKRPAEPMVTR
jgi:hypothetical protein